MTDTSTQERARAIADCHGQTEVIRMEMARDIAAALTEAERRGRLMASPENLFAEIERRAVRTDLRLWQGLPDAGGVECICITRDALREALGAK